MPKYYYTEQSHHCPTLRVDGTVGIADPCYIIPREKWSGDSGFLQSYYAATGPGPRRHAVFIFEGVPFRVKDTPGDGEFKGIAVDTAMLAEFPLEQARAQFKFEMFEI